MTPARLREIRQVLSGAANDLAQTHDLKMSVALRDALNSVRGDILRALEITDDPNGERERELVLGRVRDRQGSRRVVFTL